MTKIHELFESDRNLERRIEKVISFGATREENLKAEISEYVVTDAIEESMHDLLTNMQAAMDSGEATEVGVWISGFYGSGKSSFAKYLALALDQSITIDGQPFLKHFQDRFHRAQTKQALSTLASRFPAAVVMLDLATEQIAGSALAPVTDVLYFKALQTAGYSRFLKVAAFERKLQADGRYEEFLELCAAEAGTNWPQIQNDELVVDSVLPDLAYKMYPDIFKSNQDFLGASTESIQLARGRVEEIVNIIREHTGKEHVIFIIDEVGQYVGADQNKILDLQGFSENIKNLGQGKVWAICTAQQTLTEDDERIALNSPALFKLKDRFPISVDLKSSDIREICYKRLLAKSEGGRTALGQLFSANGQALRHNTKLEDAKYYDTELTEATFAELYPFLPSHFDILLHLLGALAKSTGGIGLRSAIKVVQDILVEAKNDAPPVADQPVGFLVNTVTLYDALKKDIERGYSTIYRSIEKVFIRFPDSKIHKNVGKTIGLLQILSNLPITTANVVALMHSGVDAAAGKDEIERIIDELLGDTIVPLGQDQQGRLKFFSEKLNDIEQERGRLVPRQMDLRRIASEALRELFEPLPRVTINGTRTVTTGIKAQTGSGSPASIAGERETIQTILELAEPADYDDRRNELLDDSRQRTSSSNLYLLGRKLPGLEDKLTDIYRCREVAEKHRSDPDQEVKDYCAGQVQMGKKLLRDYQVELKRTLSSGSFVFNGQHASVSNFDNDLLPACKKRLQSVAEEAFHKHQLAPQRAETSVAEKFLKQASNLASLTTPIDPLGLVKTQGGAHSIDTKHSALVEIRDYIDRNSRVEGKRLCEIFSNPPYGWSPDTTRYLVAAMFVAGELTLRVSGREITSPGQQAIDALKTNNTFKAVGVALRDDKPSTEALKRAAERLTDLSGERILPLEQKISEGAADYAQRIQPEISTLRAELQRLNLPGRESLAATAGEIAEILSTDGSDATARFGGEESALAESLAWMQGVKRALEHGLQETMQLIREYEGSIRALPTTGVPGQLIDETKEIFEALNEQLSRTNFAEDAVPYNMVLTELDAKISNSVRKLRSAQQDRIQQAEKDLERIPEWTEFTEEEHRNVLDELGNMVIEANDDLEGLNALVRHEFDLNQRITQLKQRIEQSGRERLRKRIETEGRKRAEKSTRIPAVITEIDRLESLVKELENLGAELRHYEAFELKVSVED